MMDEGPLTHIHEHPEIDEADLELIARLPAHPCMVADLGAGRGGFVRRANERGAHAIALDIEAHAGGTWRREGVPGVLASAFAPPFRAASFDVVRLKEIIEHVTDPRALVVAAATLLREGGCLIAHVPSSYSQLYPVGNFWDDYTHVRPFSRLGLRRLAEDSGLRVMRIDGYVAGRNTLERMLGRALARVIPHTYRLVAEKPGTRRA